jgi:TRAP-type mannitol/chloroaromatic compound transport system permease small subunit
LLPLLELVDRVNRTLGRAAAWLGFAMVLIGAWNAVALFVGPRTGLRLTSNSLTELQWYLFSVLFLFAAPAALREGAHVRVDVLHARLHPRQRDWIELCGLALFLCPFTAFVAATTWPVAWQSFVQREGSPDPNGLARWPLKLAVPVAFVLLTLQGLAEAARRALALSSPPSAPRPDRSEDGERRP